MLLFVYFEWSMPLLVNKLLFYFGFQGVFMQGIINYLLSDAVLVHQERDQGRMQDHSQH